MVLKRFASGPSGSSLMCNSDLIGTGRQLHVGSMVTSSNSELLGETADCVGFNSKTWAHRQGSLGCAKEETNFWMALRIPHMYWSTSSPSNNAVLLDRGKNELDSFLIVIPSHLQKKQQRLTYLHTGHLHVPLSQLSCK